MVSRSALRCPLATPTILLGFLLPWAWGISSRLLQRSAATSPYLDEGYLLTTALPDLQRGMAPLGPPVPVQPPLLGRGVACKAGLDKGQKWYGLNRSRRH